jgi:hypothetical protein
MSRRGTSESSSQMGLAIPLRIVTKNCGYTLKVTISYNMKKGRGDALPMMAEIDGLVASTTYSGRAARSSSPNSHFGEREKYPPPPRRLVRLHPGSQRMKISEELAARPGVQRKRIARTEQAPRGATARSGPKQCPPHALKWWLSFIVRCTGSDTGARRSCCSYQSQ